MAVSSNSVDSDSKSLNAFSDGEATTVVNGGTMKKYKSADDLEAGLAPGWLSQRLIESIADSCITRLVVIQPCVLVCI